MNQLMQAATETILDFTDAGRPDIPRSYSGPWLADRIQRLMDNGLDDGAIRAELAGVPGISQQIGVAYDFDVVEKVKAAADPQYAAKEQVIRLKAMADTRALADQMALEAGEG